MKRRSHFVTKTGIVFCILIGIAALMLRREHRFPVRLPNQFVFLHVKNLEFDYWDHVNKDGMRGTSVSPSAMEEINIFMIGDSFVYGAGTNERASIPSLVENLLAKEQSCSVSVFNLSLIGTSTRDYAKTASQYRQYQPDVVIVGLYVDNDIVEDIDLSALEQQALGTSGGKRKNDPSNHAGNRTDCPALENTFVDVFSFNLPDRLEKAMCNENMNPHLLERSRIGENHAYYEHLTHAFENGSNTKHGILTVRRMFPQSTFVLLLFPSKYQMSTRYFAPMRELGFLFKRETVVNRNIQDAILLWADTEGIYAIDLLPMMYDMENNNGIPLYYDYDDHPNETGNRAIANILYEQLKQFSLCTRTRLSQNI